MTPQTAKKIDTQNQSDSESESERDRRRHRKRRLKHHSRSRSGDESDKIKPSRHRHQKKSKHMKDPLSAPSAVPISANGEKVDQSGPEGETEEQYDARLEREEQERLETQRKKELKYLKQMQNDIPPKDGVRFKGKCINPWVKYNALREYRSRKNEVS